MMVYLKVNVTVMCVYVYIYIYTYLFIYILVFSVLEIRIKYILIDAVDAGIIWKGDSISNA